MHFLDFPFQLSFHILFTLIFPLPCASRCLRFHVDVFASFCACCFCYLFCPAAMQSHKIRFFVQLNKLLAQCVYVCLHIAWCKFIRSFIDFKSKLVHFDFRFFVHIHDLDKTKERGKNERTNQPKEKCCNKLVSQHPA